MCKCAGIAYCNSVTLVIFCQVWWLDFYKTDRFQFSPPTIYTRNVRIRMYDEHHILLGRSFAWISFRMDNLTRALIVAGLKSLYRRRQLHSVAHMPKFLAAIIILVGQRIVCPFGQDAITAYMCSSCRMASGILYGVIFCHKWYCIQYIRCAREPFALCIFVQQFDEFSQQCGYFSDLSTVYSLA